MKIAPLLLALFSVTLPLSAATYEPINAFRLGPRNPGSGPLVRHTDGNDYGTTPKGGPKGEGTVYRVTPTGAVEMVSAMDALKNPNPSGLTADGAGFLWGVSLGIFDAGTIFKIDPATGTRTTVFTFAPSATNGPNGGGPTAELFYDGAGFMWGTAAFGPNPGNHGIIFKIETATGAFTKVAGFNGTSDGPNNHTPRGTRPRGKLVAGGTGFLWGTTSFGGANGLGTVFKLEMATNAVTTVVDFTGKDGGAAKGENPTAALVADGLGFLWGTTHSANFSSDPGTVFKVAIASPHAFTSVFTFTGASGAHRGVGSGAAFVQQSPGVLLGVSPLLFTFPPDFGTIFRINATTDAQTTVLSFTGSTGLVPGSDPRAALVPVGGAGLFRGTTQTGGAADTGTVYEFNANNDTLTTKANLLGTEPPPSGAQPAGKLVADGLGFLWGVTERFGQYGKGTIFKMKIDTGEITTVVDFTGDGGAAPGSGPVSELILRNGLLWGVTPLGGIAPNTVGTIFKVDPTNNAFTSVAQMSSSGVGPSQPSGALLPGDAGFLWGCAADGGAHDEGCIYKVDAATGAIEVVVSFAQDVFSAPPATPLGSVPTGALVRDGDGNYWGTTQLGGIVADDNGSTVSYGTVFKVDPTTGTLTTVVKFTGDDGAAKGKNPNGSLISDGAGAFLGTHSLGVFKVTIASGAYKLLASIGGGVNAGLAADSTGKFWGTTREGGSGFIGQGSVFNMTATGAVQTIVSFFDTDASEPSGGLLLVGTDLYGVTAKGGVDTAGEVTGGGQIFRVRIVDPPVPATVVAIKDGDVPGETNTTYSKLGVPEPGPFASSMKVDTKTVAAIFAGDGTVRARVGGGVSGLANAVITKLGVPSGDVALATLQVDDAVGVTSKNDTVLLKGLTNGPVTIAAREGIDLGTPAGVSIAAFGAIDGAPDAASATFFLATLQNALPNGGVTKGTDSALLTVQANGTVSVLAREGQVVSAGKNIAIISALVGVKGALAEGRWRATGSSFGVRLTFADKTQALYTIPATATLPAQWTRWIGLGDTLGAPLAGAEISKLGLPAFGSDGPAVLATFKAGTGTPVVTTKNDTAIVRVDSGGLVLLAREGSTPVNFGTTIFFNKLSDPVSGANGRTAFAATLSGVTKPFVTGLWYSADGETATQLARTGLSAPGGGKFAKFTNLALPDGATSGPLFTATLAADKTLGIGKANNFGLWGVNAAGTLKLVLRTGETVLVSGTAHTVKSFTALLAAAGSIGAAHGYDNAGKVAVLATFTDKTVALLELTVP